MPTLTTTASVAYDQTAYNRLAYFALRATQHYDQFVTVMPTQQAMPGTSVKFNQTSDLSAATTALDQSTDVTAVALSDSEVTVTLAEYGNAVQITSFLKNTSYLPVDPILANVLGYNAALSFNRIIRTVAQGGSNVRYSGTGSARNTVKPTETLTSLNIRRALADLRGANAMPWDGSNYAAIIHPDVSYDLRNETGSNAWRDPHVYSDPTHIWNGEVGVYENFRFIETPEAPLFADAGSSTTLTDVYGTLFMGQEALCMAYASEIGRYPEVRVVPVIDVLSRWTGLGWYWIGGFARFREAVLRRVESASTIGTNS